MGVSHIPSSLDCLVSSPYLPVGCGVMTGDLISKTVKKGLDTRAYTNKVLRKRDQIEFEEALIC